MQKFTKVAAATRAYDKDTLCAKNKLFKKLDRLIKQGNRIKTACNRADKALRESLSINSNERECADNMIDLAIKVKGEV